MKIYLRLTNLEKTHFETEFFSLHFFSRSVLVSHSDKGHSHTCPVLWFCMDPEIGMLRQRPCVIIFFSFFLSAFFCFVGHRVRITGVITRTFFFKDQLLPPLFFPTLRSFKGVVAVSYTHLTLPTS